MIFPDRLSSPDQIRTRAHPLAGVVVALAVDVQADVTGILALPQFIANDSVHARLRSSHGLMAAVLLYQGLFHFAATLCRQFHLKDKLLN